ncbi:MAG: hypothetical protein HY805_04775 [Nitrospirae bacterium]|nr:hypothetical protein [Nitrospirota bacterium]
MKLLVFLESKEQFEEFEKIRQAYKDYAIIYCALSPFVMPHLDSKGISYVIPENFYRSEELSAIRQDTQRFVNSVVDTLDRISIGYSKKTIGIELKAGTYFEHLLWVLISGVHSKIFQLKKVISATSPDAIVGFGSVKELPLEMDFIFGAKESLYGLILSAMEGNIKIIKYSVNAQKSNIRAAIKEFLLDKLPILLILRMYGFKKGIHHILPSFGKKSVLVLGSVYNWVDVMERRTFRETFSIRYFLRARIPHKVKNYSLDGIDMPSLSFIFMGVDYGGLIDRQISLILRSIKFFSSRYRKVSELIDKVSGVFTCGYWYPLLSFVAHIAFIKGKPVICWSHGESGNRKTYGMVEGELRFTTAYFAFGEGSKAHYENEIKNLGFSGRTIAVGSPELDRLKETLSESISGSYILYATTNFYMNWFYLGFDPPFSDNSYYRTVKTILSYLESIDEAVLWKKHPMPIMGDIPIKPLSPYIRVQSEGRFSELISGARAIVIDCPATTFYEACLTEKPIFVTIKHLDFIPEALLLLKKRAVCTDTPEELISRLDGFLKTGKYPADTKNREYIRAYGTHLDDGNSAKRAEAECVKIIKRA